MRAFRLITLAILAVTMTACAGPRLPASVSLPDRFEAWDATVAEYRFRPGDELDVRLIHNLSLIHI